MVKRSPRFHRRPKDPGVDGRLVASAMTTLAFDAKEMNEKTQQCKSYEILPPEPPQQQQWCLPNCANGSSSNSNNSQYSNKDGGGDDGEEMVVFFYGEDSGNDGGTIAPTGNTTRTGGSSRTDFLKTTTYNTNDSNKSKQMKSIKYNNDNEEETITFLYDSDGGNDDSTGDTLDTTTSVDGSEPDIFDSIWQQEEENNDYNAYHDDVSVCFVDGSKGMGQVRDGGYDGANYRDDG
jgi:hypothetical protein